MCQQVSGLLQDLNNRMHLAAHAAVYNKWRKAAEAAARAAAEAVLNSVCNLVFTITHVLSLCPQVSGLLQDFNNRMHLAADAAVCIKRREARKAAAEAMLNPETNFRALNSTQVFFHCVHRCQGCSRTSKTACT